MTASSERGSLVRVGAVAEVEERGCVLVAAGGHAVTGFAHEGRCYALDNRRCRGRLSLRLALV